jgi:hypothetical protein
MLPQDLEVVAQERSRAWEKEIAHRQLLKDVLRQPPCWRRWLGCGMVGLGAWLMRWGEWIVQPTRREGISVVG